MVSVVEKFLYCILAHFILLAAESMIKLAEQMKKTHGCE